MSKMSEDPLYEYLTSHPLALEVCNFVLRKNSCTASEVAESLGKSLPTTLQSMQGLEKLGVLASRKTGRERTFEPRNRGRLQSILESDTVRNSVSKTGRLKDRTFPIVRFQDSLVSKLAEEMQNTAKITRDVRVETGLIDTRVDLMFESKKRRIALEVSRLVHPKDVYAAIGKIFTIQGSRARFDGMLALFLLHPELKLQLPGLNLWATKQLVTDTLGETTGFDIVTDFSSDGDLLDQEYAERIGTQVANSLRNLYRGSL
jgi:hypothetical protein